MYPLDKVYVTGCGRQDCHDMHSWGPGIRQNYIIHHVLNGNGCLTTCGRSYNIVSGDSFLTYPGEIIYYYPDKKSPWEYEWIDFVGDAIPGILEKTVFNQKNPICHLPKEINIEYYFSRLQSIDIYNNNRQEAAGILFSILGCFVDYLPDINQLTVDKRDERLSNALRIIATNYHKSDFHISSLCSKLMINRITLYRLFTNSFLTSPNAYLLNYRIEQAGLLLKQGFSVKQTSLSCGFSDPFYFSKVFKKHTGISPSFITGRKNNSQN